jgi:fatty-acyl-CoA synthase
MEVMGFAVRHLYGLTETFGPVMLSPVPPWMERLPLADRAVLMARQGIHHVAAEASAVLDADYRPVPADGCTIGEVMLRGNTVMMGYLNNPSATAEAFAGGWLHTGDLAVMHPDGSIEVKDRSKDIIISGGENISSLEVEEVLYRHPDVVEAAVVAHPDDKWGEVPHAYVTLGPTETPPTEVELIDWCRGVLAHFKCPRYLTFCRLPKTSTGKIQKHALRQVLREQLAHAQNASVYDASCRMADASKSLQIAP